MAVCPTPGTGGAFLSRTLSFIDCHARSFGEAGYLALSTPGSIPLTLMTIALTLFVAFYGIRLALGHMIAMPELMLSVAKIGVVMMLVVSWPAVRTLIFDTTMSGPDEIAVLLGAETIGVAKAGNARLQRLDNGMIELTRVGTGRDNSIGTDTDGTPAAEAFKGVPASDDTGFAIGRYAFLTSIIGASALVKIGAGLLIALTPLFALFVLFGATRSLFSGWLRALLASALGGLVITIMFQAQAMLLEPWLVDALTVRAASYVAPSAPIELAVMTTAFALATFSFLGLIARLCFFSNVPSWFGEQFRQYVPAAQNHENYPVRFNFDRSFDNRQIAEPSRALVIADAVANTQRHEQLQLEVQEHRRSDARSASPDQQYQSRNLSSGSSARRHSRVSALGIKRDAS